MPSVKVEQTDGEIIVRDGGDEPVTYKVSGGSVSVPAEDVDLFVNVVEGASVAATQSKEGGK